VNIEWIIFFGKYFFVYFEAKAQNKHISIYIAFLFHGKKYLYIEVLIFGFLRR
jgi:hypothetical protein